MCGLKPSSATPSAATAVAAAATAATVAATEAAATERSAFLFVHFVGEVVLSVDVSDRGGCWFEFAISAYVEAHGAAEEAHIAVLDVDGVAFIHLLDVVIPEAHVDGSGFVSDENVGYSVWCAVASRECFSDFSFLYDLYGHVYLA